MVSVRVSISNTKFEKCGLVMSYPYLSNDVIQCKDDEEIVAVIAHELGHWKLNHTVYTFVAMQVCVIAFLN